METSSVTGLAGALHIIAEAGTNHNGHLAQAKNLAAIAKRAGAHSVKFQIIYPWGLYLPGEYEYGHYEIKEVIRLREQSVMSDEAYADLAAYCRELQLPLSASIFDERGLELLLKLNPPYVKVASCDLNNLRLLRQVAERGKRLVLSTGMSTLAEIDKSVKELERVGFHDLVLMHCVSIYPAALPQTNLAFIPTLKEAFGYAVGFSDHTGTSTSACMAVALGATWFEKHFTEDRRQVGLDHAYAMESEGLAQYVADLTEAATAMTPVPEKLSEAERYTKRRARRSLYAAYDLAAGQVVTEADVLCVRPENVMRADELDLVVGRQLIVPMSKHQPFRPEYLA